MQKTLKPEIVYCSECHTPILCKNMTKSRKDVYYRNGHAYCSIECRNAFCRRLSSETMSKTNKKYASARMKLHNPMSNPEIRSKMANTLREIGHKPLIQGGNGRGLTKPQSLLMEQLISLNPVSEFIVKTGAKKINQERYPAHYKIDIAIPTYMLAIEVNGGSHCSIVRREQDLKKKKFLELKGWTVLSFWNKEVIENIEDCIQTIMSTISKSKA